MNTEHDLAAVPAGPPWSLDVIADLHAGVFPPKVEAELRARISQDRDAQAMVAALNSVVDELSLLPPMRMPERYASRLDSVIAAESAARSQAMAPSPSRSSSAPPPVSVVSSPTPPAESVRPFLSVVPQQGFTGPGQRPAQLIGQQPVPGGSAGNVRSLDAARRRRRGMITGLGIAAAVAAIATVSISALNSTPSPSTALQGPVSSSAQDLPAPNALQIDLNNVKDAYQKINGKKQGSYLSNPVVYASCLSANGIQQADVLGVADATYAGKPVSAIAVAVDATHADLYIVGPGCGPGGAQFVVKLSTTR